jgi:catechol 2,3-dioxygenase-like lactoylglutathione lyase family enzyme
MKIIPGAALLLSCFAFTLLPVVAAADALLPLDSGRAHVYLMRPDVGANEVDVSVSVDGNPAGRLGYNEYLAISVPPGQHAIYLDTGRSTLKHGVSVGAGDGAYLVLRVESSSFNYLMSLDSMPRDVAERYLKHSDSAAARPVMLEGGTALAASPPVPVAAAPVAAAAAIGAESPAALPAPSAPSAIAGGSVGLPSGLSIVTLGVQNLELSVRFYQQALGFSLSSTSTRDIAFFELQGSWLALYSRDALAADAGIPLEEPAEFSGLTLAHNVADRDSVDRVLKAAEAAGAEVVKPAQEAFWGGYSGYFRDPDGFLWEVAWNPHLPMRP